MTALTINYDPATGQLASVSNTLGGTASINTAGFDGGTIPSAITDISGGQTQTVQDQHGNVIRSIQTNRNSDGTVSGYLVTVHEYNYVDGIDYETMMDEGIAQQNFLFSIDDYNPISLPATASQADLLSAKGSLAHQQNFYSFSDSNAVNASGEDRVENFYDANSRQLHTDTTYDVNNAPVTTTYEYYKFGKPQKVTDGNNVATYFKYDGQGNLAWSCDSTGLGTMYEYLPASGNSQAGNAGNLISKTYQVQITGFASDIEGGSTATIVKLSDTPLSSNVYYDDTAPMGSRWRLKSTTDATGVRTAFAYDALGRQTASGKLSLIPDANTPWNSAANDANWIVSQTKYDDAGRTVESDQAVYTAVSGDNFELHWQLAIDESGDSVVEILNPLATSSVYTSVLSSTVYNASGQVWKTTDEYGGVTENRYDVRGNLVETISPDSSVTISTYDAQGRVAVSVDRFIPEQSEAVHATRTIYNLNGQVSETQSLSISADDVSVTVDPANDEIYNVTVDISDATVLSSSSTYYDEQGRVIESDNADGLRTGTIYYSNGQAHYTGVLASGSPVGGHSVTASGVTTIAFGTGDFDTYTTYVYHQYDTSTGKPFSGLYYDRVIDANGHHTDSYTDPVTHNSYTVFNDGTYTQTLNVYGVDNFGYGVDTLISSDELTTFNIVKQTIKIDQRGIATSDLYDLAGRLQMVIEADPTSSDGLGDGQTVWRYRYDVNGNQTFVLAPRDGMRENFGVLFGSGDTYEQRTLFDEFGRAIEQSSYGILDEEVWTYDVHGRVASDAYGNPTQSGWYADRRVVYTYDSDPADGGRLEREDRSSGLQATTVVESTLYSYDEMGRQSAVEDKVHDNTGTLTSDRTEYYAYDPISGGVTIDATAEGTVHHVYDDQGRLQSTWTDVSVESIEDAQSQDIADAITRTDYAYDTFGRLSTVTLSKENSTNITADNVTTYQYDDVGNLKTTEEGHSSSGTDHLFTRTSYAYDDLNRLETETVKKIDNTGGTEAATNVAGYTYSYTDDSQKSGEVDVRYDDAGAVFSTTTITYTYDNQDRLTSEEHVEVLGLGAPGGTTASVYKDTYTLDAEGNRLLLKHDDGDDGTVDTTTESQYGWTNPDKLSETITYAGDGTGGTMTSYTTYNYNPDGATNNVTMYPTGSASVATLYYYDLRGRVIQTNINWTEYHFFTYDAGGRRVKDVQIGSDQSTVEQVQTKLMDNTNPTGYSQVLEVRTASSAGGIATAVPDTYILGMNVEGQWLASPGSIQYFLYDGHGSVRGIEDGNGILDMTQRLDYDAFGSAINFDPSTAASKVLYVGQWWDLSVKGYDNRFRIYDPTTGRFISQDVGGETITIRFHSTNICMLATTQ